MTPTTTRPARPRRSASSPADRACSRSPTRHPDGRQVTRRPVQTKLYVHLSLADLAAHAAGIPTVGEVEKLGPATLDLIRDWLHDSKAIVQPVLDLNNTDAVDRHDPPPRMREQVILRDSHCVFPWCGRDARTDRPRPHRAVRAARRGRATRADQPTKVSRRCVGGITGPRRSPAGPTNAPATAPTPGPAPTADRSPSDPTAPGGPVRPNPPTKLRRTRSPPDSRGSTAQGHANALLPCTTRDRVAP